MYVNIIAKNTHSEILVKLDRMFKVNFFKADRKGGGSEGQISPEAIKADKKGGGSEGRQQKSWELFTNHSRFTRKSSQIT